MKAFGLYIILMCCGCIVSAQDLNAHVSVVAPKIQTTNKRIFKSLETAMKDFLNGRKWINDAILPQERLDCTFILNVTAWDGSSTFSGELQVQSSRPVYNSAYTTSLFSVNDKDFDFTYDEGQTIDYSDQTFLTNLSSVMAFYAYIIAGFDYDSFSRYGGSAYFALAQQVVINAQTSSYKGWKAFDDNINRYWLSENMNNKLYAPLRSFIYDYYRNGLDVMADNVVNGRKTIASILPVLAQTDRQRLGAMFPLVFFSAKADELVSIFSNSDAQERLQAMNTLTRADPSNGIKYQALLKSN